MPPDDRPDFVEPVTFARRDVAPRRHETIRPEVRDAMRGAPHFQRALHAYWSLRANLRRQRAASGCLYELTDPELCRAAAIDGDTPGAWVRQLEAAVRAIVEREPVDAVVASARGRAAAYARWAKAAPVHWPITTSPDWVTARRLLAWARAKLDYWEALRDRADKFGLEPPSEAEHPDHCEHAQDDKALVASRLRGVARALYGEAHSYDRHPVAAVVFRLLVRLQELGRLFFVHLAAALVLRDQFENFVAEHWGLPEPTGPP